LSWGQALGRYVLILPLAFAGVASAAQNATVEIIVSPDHARVVINRDLLRGIFTMRVRQWPDGAAIRVFVLPDASDVTDRFCRERLGTYPYVLRAGWDRMVFTGTGFAPTIVDSEADMRSRVLATPGAIGYVGSGTGWESAVPSLVDAHRPAPGRADE
jgi:ABC-type phosphate transport system substrate-binding protein